MILLFMPEDNGEVATATWTVYVDGDVDDTYVEPDNWDNHILLIEEELRVI